MKLKSISRLQLKYMLNFGIISRMTKGWMTSVGLYPEPVMIQLNILLANFQFTMASSSRKL